LVLVVLIGAMSALGGTKEASAGLQVNIDIAIPPPLQFSAPPDVYVVPSGSSYVYMAPDYEGVYFYGGYWYRIYNDHWFRSSHYNERWDYIETSNVPQVIIVVPPEYIHHVPSGYYRIHYDDYHNNWQSWDHGRHWDNYDWYQHERRDDTRRERYNSINSYRQQRGIQPTQHQQGYQQQNVQPSHHQQGHQQQNVEPSQHQQKQGHQQQNVQPSQHQHQQGHQQQNVQKPQHQQKQGHQEQNVQKPQHQQGHQQQNVQKQQHQQGGKKHEEDK